MRKHKKCISIQGQSSKNQKRGYERILPLSNMIKPICDGLLTHTGKLLRKINLFIDLTIPHNLLFLSFQILQNNTRMSSSRFNMPSIYKRTIPPQESHPNQFRYSTSNAADENTNWHNKSRLFLMKNNMHQ